MARNSLNSRPLNWCRPYGVDDVSESSPLGNNHGMTLIELLVGLAVFALLITLISASLIGGRQTLELIDKNLQEPPPEIVQGVLRQMLARIEPSIIAEQTNDPERALVGQNTAIRFVAENDIRGQFAGTYQIEVLLEAGPDGLGRKDLVVKQRLYRAKTIALDRASGPAPQELRTILLKDVSRLSFRYYGSSDANVSAQWHDVWINRASLPRVVELRIERSTGAGLLMWPPLSVALRHE
jgi:prepilin-type N-terminal cleavage/methylation domain-containing protein